MPNAGIKELKLERQVLLMYFKLLSDFGLGVMGQGWDLIKGCSVLNKQGSLVEINNDLPAGRDKWINRNNSKSSK
jgi:hypothetical protein